MISIACDFYCLWFLLLVISIDDTSVFVISIADAVTTRVTSSAVLLSIEPSIIVNIVIIVIVTVIVGYDQWPWWYQLTWTRDPVFKHLVHLLTRVISIGFRG